MKKIDLNHFFKVIIQNDLSLEIDFLEDNHWQATLFIDGGVKVGLETANTPQEALESLILRFENE